MQLHYNVDYILDGQEQTETKIWSSDPGSAMAAVLKKYKGSTIIKAWVQGRHGHGYSEWSAPIVHREPIKEPKPARALKPNERGCEFPFYDEVVRPKE